MSKHTPEPWAVDEYMAVGGLTGMLIDNAGNHIGTAFNVTMSAEAVTNARRIVTCVNACAGMADPAAEIAELKRQRDELLGLVKAVSYHSIPVTVDGIKCAAFPWSEYESMVIKAKGGSS